jgi:hypothetical protein
MSRKAYRTNIELGETFPTKIGIDPQPEAGKVTKSRVGSECHRNQRLLQQNRSMELGAMGHFSCLIFN